MKDTTNIVRPRSNIQEVKDRFSVLIESVVPKLQEDAYNKGCKDTLIRVKNEILRMREAGYKYPDQKFGGYMDTLDIIGGMLSKLQKK